jgi:hypothetical protein
MLPVALDRTSFIYVIILREVPMFDSLDDQMRKDEDRVSSSKERMMRWALYILAAGVVFGGLIFGVHFMS